MDGKFSGSTPSKLQLTEGAHVILVEQTGYAVWQRTVTISPGNDININAVLTKTPGTQ
ncbi:PEGA domain-containing protein [Tunturiibacter psychrotolerans]|uniref:PEGA domain-containing protein n=1 Tax=Tunturiibacter psychrotolerans TaxID=3069686 RepID=UPI003D211387